MSKRGQDATSGEGSPVVNKTKVSGSGEGETHQSGDSRDPEEEERFRNFALQWRFVKHTFQWRFNEHRYVKKCSTHC